MRTKSLSKKKNFNKTKNKRTNIQLGKNPNIKGAYYMAINNSSLGTYKMGDIVFAKNFVLQSKILFIEGELLNLDTSQIKEVFVSLKNFELIPKWASNLADKKFPIVGTRVISLKDSGSDNYYKGDIGTVYTILPKNNYISPKTEVLVDFGNSKIFPIHPKNFKTYLKKNKIKLENPSAIISYNMSWATQDDKITGSEINFVKECKTRSKTAKYNKSITGLSYCTNNLANFLINIVNVYNLEIIGFQEPSGNNVEIIRDMINSQTNEKYKITSSKTYVRSKTILMHNEKLGPSKRIEEGDLNPGNGRPYQIVLFPKVGYLVLNTHFQHGLYLYEYDYLFDLLEKKVITSFKRKGIQLSIIKRIIFTGDFNDHNNRLNKRRKIFFKPFLGHNLRCGDIKNNGIPKTCCYNPPLRSIGNTLPYKSDYILDTYPQQYFGIPKEYDIATTMSDHLPVIGITNY